MGTILHWAAQNNRPDIFDTLKPYIKSKHVNLESKRGNIPLHSAVASNNVAMVKSLLEISDIDVNVLNRWRSYPIEFANSAEMVLLLVKAGADVESEEGQHSLASVMMGFAEKGDAKSLETLLSHKLLKNKIDVNIRVSIGDYNNATMLEVAAWQGDVTTLKILSKYGADANLKSIHHITEKYSNTKDRAEKNKIKDVMTVLVLLFDANLTLKDYEDKAPLDYLKDTNVKQELESVRNLRDKINKTTNIDANNFVLNLLTKDPKKSIADHVKNLNNNFDALMDEYVSTSNGVNKPSASLNDVECTSPASKKKDPLKQSYTVQ